MGEVGIWISPYRYDTVTGEFVKRSGVDDLVIRAADQMKQKRVGRHIEHSVFLIVD